jgi:hypothetical protein
MMPTYDCMTTSDCTAQIQPLQSDVIGQHHQTAYMNCYIAEETDIMLHPLCQVQMTDASVSFDRTRTEISYAML